MSHAPWDDARLSAAFRDRYRSPAPAGIAEAAMAHVREAAAEDAMHRRPLARLRRHLAGLGRAGFLRSPALAGAAAVLIVAVAGLGLVVTGHLPGASDDPRSNGSLASPPASEAPPTAAPSEAPSAAPSDDPSDDPSPRSTPVPTELVWSETAYGLPVISITEAIALRDAGPDDTELAVRGWYTQLPPMRCAAQGEAERFASPIFPYCSRTFRANPWLTENPEVLVHATSKEMSLHGPEGPALDVFIGPELGLTFDAFDATSGDSVPVPVVLLGHFGDHRASLCAPIETICRQQFVVDAQAWPAASAPSDSPTWSDLEVEADGRVVSRPAMSAVEVMTRVSTMLSSSQDRADSVRLAPLVVGVTVGERIASIEPLAASDPDLIGSPVVWVIRVLDMSVDGAPRVRTFLLSNSRPLDLIEVFADRIEVVPAYYIID